MKLLTLFFLLAIIAMAIISVGYFTASFKARRFDEECIYLENLIKRSEITAEAYDEIQKCYDDLDCTTESDCRRKKALWSGFQFRFREISKYKI